jgi:hypothetical protein
MLAKRLLHLDRAFVTGLPLKSPSPGQLAFQPPTEGKTVNIFPLDASQPAIVWLTVYEIVLFDRMQIMAAR